jgi:hypothetical protein
MLFMAWSCQLALRMPAWLLYLVSSVLYHLRLIYYYWSSPKIVFTSTWWFIYVDYILIDCSAPDVVTSLCVLLEIFHIKDLSTLECFLGLEESYSFGCNTLTQCKNALDLVHCVNMDNCKSTTTSLANMDQIAHCTCTPLGTDDSFWYRVVGGLQYLTLTHSDISFVVNKVCHFLLQPIEVH